MQDALRVCQCPDCEEPGDHPNKERHRQMIVLLKQLNERQRRLFVALESNRMGHGGDRLMSLITGMNVRTIRKGRQELNSSEEDAPSDRVRRPGAGRPKAEKKNETLETTLSQLLAEETAGDPMTKQKWVRLSLKRLCELLAKQGYCLAQKTVRRLLVKLGYSLKANRKRITGPPHPDRDRQFRYIARTKKQFLQAGCPVISVDTKKKELVGNFKNPGRTWSEKGDEVNCHDFLQDAEGRASPYGVYVLSQNRGFVSVGLSADTPEFAVDAITAWWKKLGKRNFRNAPKTLILADAGGSNGCRPRLWKLKLQEFADASKLEITVCHYPRGASKWNPIEHRMFSFISINWAAIPLRTVEILLRCIQDTTTESGLKVTAALTPKAYKKGVKVSKQQMETLRIRRHRTCPNWNYTITPRP